MNKKYQPKNKLNKKIKFKSLIILNINYYEKMFKNYLNNSIYNTNNRKLKMIYSKII